MKIKSLVALIPVVITGCSMSENTQTNTTAYPDPDKVVLCQEAGIREIIKGPGERMKCELIAVGCIEQIAYEANAGIVTADIQFSIEEVLQGETDQEVITVRDRQGYVSYEEYIECWPEPMQEITIQEAKKAGIDPDTFTYVYLEPLDLMLLEGDRCLFGLMKSDDGHYYMQNHIADAFINLGEAEEFIPISGVESDQSNVFTRDADLRSESISPMSKEQIVEILNSRIEQ